MKKYRFDQFAQNITKKKVPSPDEYSTYIGLEHMDSGEIHVNRWGSSVPIIGEKLIMHKGDILLGKRNAYLRRAAIAPHDGVFSAHGMILRPIEDIMDYDFFALFIASDYFFDEAIKISVGSLSPTINWSDLKSLEFNIPSIEKQKKIAKVLWSIKDVITSYKKMIDSNKKIMMAEFSDRFNNSNSVYPKLKLAEVFDIADNLRKPLNDTVRSEMHDGENLYPYYGANGIVDYINEYLCDISGICIAEDCGSYGAGENTTYKVNGKCWVNNHAHILIPKNNCDIDYANAFFKINDFSKYVTGTTRLKLTQSKLKEIEVLLPPIEEQKEFADFVNICTATIEKLEESIDSLQKIYREIMYKTLNEED